MTEEEILAALRSMETNPDLITNSAYRVNTEIWPDNRIPFAEAHLSYLKSHPALNPEHYLSNLRLMLRRKPTRHSI